MFDLVADYPRDNNKLPSVHQKCIPAELERCPMVEVSAEEEAQLIMRKLIYAYLERGPVQAMAVCVVDAGGCRRAAGGDLPNLISSRRHQFDLASVQLISFSDARCD
jgi:hypothetical protein